MGKCFLCGKECDSRRDEGHRGGSDFYSCSNCGRYYIIGFFLETYKNLIEDNKHIISGYLYEANRKITNTIDLTNNEIERILKSERIPRTSVQKLEKILLYLYKNNEYIGQHIDLTDVFNTPSIVYATNITEIDEMLKALVELRWLNMDNNSVYKISVNGLTHAEELMTFNINSNKVFIAMQFRRVDGYAFPYTEVRDKAIKPAVEVASNNKLRAFTVDEEEHNDYITDKMIAEIKTSRFLITDLTHNNNGVYWEAGFAKGLGKEVIYTCNQDWLDSGNKLHFDIEHISGIRWRTLDELKEKLINRIKATIL